MSDKRLLPCPFCGGEAKFVTQNSVDECYGVRCDNFGCVAFDILPCYIEKAEAITAWNTRKPMERVVEKLEELPDYLHRQVKGDFVKKTDVIEIVNGEM